MRFIICKKSPSWLFVAVVLATLEPGHRAEAAALNIGWAEQEITPTGPVLIAGQFPARVSEGVLDPLLATVLVLESDGEHVVWVSCDLVSIPNELRDAVRSRLAGRANLTPR